MSVKHTVLPEGHPSRCFYNCVAQWQMKEICLPIMGRKFDLFYCDARFVPQYFYVPNYCPSSITWVPGPMLGGNVGQNEATNDNTATQSWWYRTLLFEFNVHI